MTNIHPYDPKQPPAPDSLEAILQAAVERFKTLTPEQQERSRKNIFETITGLPYPPPNPPLDTK